MKTADAQTDRHGSSRQTADSPGRDGWPQVREGGWLDNADRADLEARLAMSPMERLLALEQFVQELDQIRRADVSPR